MKIHFNGRVYPDRFASATPNYFVESTNNKKEFLKVIGQIYDEMTDSMLIEIQIRKVDK
jgi:hypothetical protein